MASKAGPSCGYCIEILDSMTDPRRLPCGHIFCLPCLRNDLNAGGTDTKCPECRALHEDLDLDELPEVDQEIKEEDDSALPPVYCSRNCHKVAIAFCGDCSSRLCKGHKKAHDTFLGDSHKYVSFDEYRRIPERYDQPICTSHNRRLTLACDGCDLITCEECDLTSNCGHYGNSHKFQSLAKREKKITQEYKEFVAAISKLHTEFKEKEKHTFDRFEHLVVTYNEEEKLKAIDKMAAEQIAEIKRRVEIKKRQVKDFPAKMDDEVTSYTEELQEKEQKLGDLEHSLSIMMRESHITEIIRQNKENRKKIEDARTLTTGNCDILREMVVAPTGYMGDVEADLRPLVPTKLTKFFSGSSSEKAYCLTLTDQGDLLYYASNTVKITDSHMQVVKASVKVSNVISLAQRKDKVYVVTYQDKKLSCVICNCYGLAPSSLMCKYRTENIYSNYSPIAICQDYVVLIDNSSYSYNLRIYTEQGEHVRNISFTNKLLGIWSLSDGNVFVRDGQLKMFKCYLNTATMTKSQVGANSHSVVSVDGMGLCFSLPYGRKNEKIHFHKYEEGAEAKLLVELASQETRTITAMSVRNNTLALTDDNSRVHLYHIGY